MKRFMLLLVAGAVVSIPAFAGTKGNGAPSGPHYDLNIIAVPQGKTAPLTNSDRHTIFVPLAVDGETVPDDTDIFLTQGPFQVCDGNGFLPPVDCSGAPLPTGGGNSTGAVFELPCNTNIATATGTDLIPCPPTGAMASYSVWGRVVGTPGGTTSTITTCATDTFTNTLVCSVASNVAVFMPKTNKPPVFSDVTNALTSIVTLGACTLTGPGSTKPCTVSLFATGFVNFFWAYDNDGLKVLQLRFYLNE